MAIKDSSYDRETIEKADSLWVKGMTLPDVSEIMDIPTQTLRGWSRKGWISKENPRSFEKGPKASNETVRRAEDLLQDYPPRKVEEITGIRRRTLQSWRRRGWISYPSWSGDKDGQRKVEPRRVVQYYFEKEGRTVKEAADYFGISESTAYRYFSEYRRSE